ncbi:MAG: hypothetical protein JXR31_11750 [Prolixibacteraceae bacterium]|nr:hypothetical protein [Prolixibacteraceae bacterium]MBN2774918.1 hypothetical protein [Prolixibacteraceae bacterium]
MKNKGIVIFLILLTIVVVVIIVGDFTSTRPDKQGENPYEFSVDEYTKVDPDLIQYKETKNFRLVFENPEGIAYYKQKLYVLGDQRLQVISNSGNLLKEIELNDFPTSIAVDSTYIIIGFNNYISTYSINGELIKKWDSLGENSVITSLAVWNNELFIADAGLRKVLRYTMDGQKISDFEGKHEEAALHGFIVPSGYFDLAFNTYGDLWVVNPGNHSLENYSLDGSMREFWQASSVQIDGFSGCCNPAQFTFLPDGSFVTSEKGLVRIKIYKPSGEFKCVVAAPEKFTDEGYAPEVVSDENGNIYAVDFNKKMIRLFEPV